MTTLHFTLSVEGLDSNTFVVTKFEGDEVISQQVTPSAGLCTGYRYDVQLASRNASIDVNDIIDKTAQLTLYQNRKVVKRIHGVVSRFSHGDTGHHHTLYGLTLVPALERLSLRQNSRIFQHKSVPDIISILLKEMKIEHFAFSLRQEYSPREFCVQYNETDLEFVQRLLAEEGLVYSFVFSQHKHTLLFTDSSASLPTLPISVPYNSLAGGHADESYIRSLHRSTTSQESHAILKDRFFKRPKYSFLHESVAQDVSYQRSDYEYFDATGRFKSDSCGEKFSRVRLEYLRREASQIQGKSDVAELQAGYRFDLTHHLDDDFNTQWLLVSVHHRGEQPQALEEAAGAYHTAYTNDFIAIPKHINWQGQPTTRPIMSGPLIATVVGPENEEIYCDEFGRVKVQFPWDRYSKGDEYSSCWIRVAEGWAGSQYGMMAMPRVGHEVIVEFLHGDPDQPIITGRTFHSTNTPPYSLPKHKTKTVIRTETHQGEGYNELSFEDQSGKEQFFIHAQKDWDCEIQHDLTLNIKRDKHLTISGNQYTQIQGNDHHTVEGESRYTVGKDHTLIVEGDLHLEAGSVWVNESGSEIHIKAGNKVVIEAGSEITMKAAGSFLKVDPAGVHLVGNAVNLNSGGSASNGSGFSGQETKLPRTLQNNTSINATQPIEISASKTSDFPTVTKVQAKSLSNASTGETNNPLPIDSSEKEESLRLKSALLKPSLTLDKLANRESRPYKKGASGQEVEYIQQALIKLGFDLGKFGADGDYGSTTERQIKLFQESYTPTNQTHLAYDVGAVDGITGQGTILGLDEALVEGWVYDNDEMDLKWLTVSKGQLTFDAEGNDIRGSLHFSRTIHWPGNAKSGVTIGRGYDCGNRSEQEIYSDLTSSGVEIETASAISQSTGLKGSDAKLFVEQHGKGINDITRKDQYNLFKLVYPQYEKRASTNYEKWTSKYKDTRVEWVSLDSKIRDVLVDFVYQGFTKGPRPMTKGMSNDKEILIEYIEKSSVLSSYEPGRQRANYLRN